MDQEITIKQLAEMLNQAVTLQREGDKEGAKKKYEEVLFFEKSFKIPSPSQGGGSQETLIKNIFSQVHNNLGIFLEEENHWGQALGSFRSALNLSPGNVEALTNMARVSSKRMNFDQALVSAKAALELKPDYIPAVIQLCRVCYNLGLLGDALKALEKVESELDTNIRLNVEYGRILEKDGRLGEAAEKLEKAVALGPDNIYALLNLANVNFQLNLFAHALANYQKILSINPKHVLALTSMGFLLQTMGQLPDALKCYQLSLAENPGHHETLAFYASLLELTGRPKEAIELVEKLLKMPKITERAVIIGSLAKANSERKLGLLDDSIATLKGMKVHAKTSATRTQISYGLGFSYDRLKKTGEAFAEFEKGNLDFLKTNHDLQSARPEFPKLLDDLLAANFSEYSLPPAKEKNDKEAPVFIVGPPLSGSLVISQLIQYTPKVSVYEDTHEIQGIRRQLMNSNLGYPGCLEGLGDEELEYLKTLFNEVHEKSIPKGEGGRAIMVDALHIIDLPLILKLFPNAKFVLVQSDPRDSVLNTFMKDFVPTRVTINYTDLGTITDLYIKTMNLWDKYQKELSPNVLNVKYEDFIKDPKKGLQTILKFIGYKDLKDAKKAFERDDFFNKVEELSVKFPPGRWKGYRGYLGDVLERLEPYFKAQGYKN